MFEWKLQLFTPTCPTPTTASTLSHSGSFCLFVGHCSYFVPDLFSALEAVQQWILNCSIFCVFLGGWRWQHHAQIQPCLQSHFFTHLFICSNGPFCEVIDPLQMSGLHRDPFFLINRLALLISSFFPLDHTAKPKSNSSSGSRAQKNNPAQQRNKKQVGVPASYTRGHHTPREATMKLLFN